jgi:hypothetical protein
MDTQTLGESTTDAIRYWESRRLAYNALLIVIVALCFGIRYPASRAAWSIDTGLHLFALAVIANVAYCMAYLVDIFAQASAYRDAWRRCRWILLAIGTSFAGILTRSIALGMFQ